MSLDTGFWRLKVGTCVVYEFLEVKGTYDRESMTITLDESFPRTPVKTPWTDDEFVQLNCVEGLHLSIPAVMRVDTKPGVSPNPLKEWKGALYNGPCRLPGLPAYMGEVGGISCTQWPPQPIVTFKPIAGETFTVPAFALLNDGTGTPTPSSVPCRYKTQSTSAVYQGKPGYTVTSLEERYTLPNEGGNVAYRYTFDPEGNLVEAVSGEPQADGSLKNGRVYRAVKIGTFPSVKEKIMALVLKHGPWILTALVLAGAFGVHGGCRWML